MSSAFKHRHNYKVHDVIPSPALEPFFKSFMQSTASKGLLKADFIVAGGDIPKGMKDYSVELRGILFLKFICADDKLRYDLSWRESQKSGEKKVSFRVSGWCRNRILKTNSEEALCGLGS